jgi:imidazole glycerol phosphate synthase subunit HisF
MLDYQADEVVILDISSKSQSVSKKISRIDLEHQASDQDGLEALLKENVDWLLYPLAVGGGIRTLEHANKLVSLGADKVVLNSALRDNRQLLKDCSDSLGSQAVVVSLDVVESGESFEIYNHRTGTVIKEKDILLRQIEEAQSLGCGELLINNVSRDGKRQGFNEELLEIVAKNSSVPVIVAGGAGSHQDFKEAISKGVSAVAASNFFHSHELSYPKLKNELAKIAPIRDFLGPSKHIARERFDTDLSPIKLVNGRIEKAELMSTDYGAHYLNSETEFMRCSSCLYPIHSATSLSFDSRKICSGCSRANDFKSQKKSGAVGKAKLRTILTEGMKSKEARPYDCVIAVSGGKDSYFQTHFVKNELGLNPLLVTYDANNWTPTGRENMERMSSVFSVDHEIIAPPSDLLSKMNLLGLILMGDMSWHAHVGIFTAPMRVAVEKKIPFAADSGMVTIVSVSSNSKS